MSMFLAPPFAPGVEITYQYNKVVKNYNICDWKKGLIEFCSLLHESALAGMLDIGHVRMIFDMKNRTYTAHVMKQVFTERPCSPLGSICHKKRDIKSLLEGLVSLTDNTSELNLQFQNGGTVTIWKREGLLEITTKDVPLLE